MNKKRSESSINLRMAAIIVSGILGVVSIVGAFWGKEGVRGIIIGMVILAALLTVIGFESMTRVD